MFEIREKVKHFIQSKYDIKELYCDAFHLVRWFDGFEQPPHSDSMKNTDDYPLMRQRAFGSILYLNHNYEGGETYYPQHNLYITPKAGSLAVHPSDPEFHLHGVTKVKVKNGNLRYTLASFWTQEEAHWHRWSPFSDQGT